MANSPNDLLFDWLTVMSPTCVLNIGPAQPPALRRYCRDDQIKVICASTPAEVAAVDHQPEAAIISEAVEKLSLQTGQALLAAPRNLLIPNVLATIDHNQSPEWDFNHLIALGFRRLAMFTDHDRALAIYAYSLTDYNPKRAWNNAENWANPEMFGKYWW
ncbi:DUF6231 family protein [Hahella aquimaris]|uniref:DUF6231 family protein n=1 Tax=Hahella sp. HNIBRBA332 TaxID=3015983 RepID=UPI00273C58EA|nr:DUF6231 family protein [Hahella sp. HNIBRBA332]WLQ17352.1 DUF6231 family protein [Hahella sp. HNIBRBA332]